MNKYLERRNRLRALLAGETGIVVFLGNVESPAQYFDNAYKWRQDSNWLYYFGIDEPRFAAVLDLDSGAETVYADDFGIDDIIWMGRLRKVPESVTPGPTPDWTLPWPPPAPQDAVYTGSPCRAGTMQ